MNIPPFLKAFMLRHKTLAQVAIVGGGGALIQACLLFLFVEIFHSHPVLANTVAAEIAIICNFMVNNRWTFKKQSNHSLPKRFVMFNMSALGSVLIQAAVIAAGMHLFGSRWYLVYAAIGILLGLILNYTVYTRIVWRHHKQ